MSRKMLNESLLTVGLPSGLQMLALSPMIGLQKLSNKWDGPLSSCLSGLLLQNDKITNTKNYDKMSRKNAQWVTTDDRSTTLVAYKCWRPHQGLDFGSCLISETVRCPPVYLDSCNKMRRLQTLRSMTKCQEKCSMLKMGLSGDLQVLALSPRIRLQKLSDKWDGPLLSCLSGLLW